MDMTTYLKNKIYDHVLRNTAYTSPTTVYLALFTTATSDAGGGTEVTGGSYARQAVAFDAPTDGAGSNTAIETFTNMPTATITHAALYDALSGGNMLLHGALLASKSVNAGDSLTFAIGDIDAAWS